jgi:hydroxyacylglutathione hydrolase
MCVVVDPGSSDEVISYLKQHQLELESILITHHHWDHIDGLAALQACTERPIPVYAPSKNKAQVSQATQYVNEGDRVEAIGLSFLVRELPGHTLGHIAYYAEELKWLFSGDVLFGLGCGRLFEGTFEQQFTSLNKIKNLGAGVKVFCTHEYTERNLAFCKDVLLPQNKLVNAAALQAYEKGLTELRSQQKPSVPLELSEEMKCNPFLIAHNLEEFTEIRQLRNNF